MIQGQPLIIQLFLPEWRKVWNAGLGGKEELYPSVITILHHAHASAPSRLRQGMDGLQGRHPQAATAHREQLGLLIQTPSIVWGEVFMIPWSPGGSLFFKVSSSRVISDFPAFKSYLEQTKVPNENKEALFKGPGAQRYWGEVEPGGEQIFQNSWGISFLRAHFLPQQLSASFWLAQTQTQILWVSAKATLFYHLWHLALCLLPAAGPSTPHLPETSSGVTF